MRDLAIRLENRPGAIAELGEALGKAGDVDETYADALERGIEIVYPLTDEPWGVRRFFAIDPNDAVINVVSHR